MSRRSSAGVRDVAKHPRRGLYWALSAFRNLSQTDSPQECQSNEKYHETKSLFLPERPSGVTHSTRISTPPSARLALNRSGKDDFKFSLAANSAINFILS